MKDFFRQIHLYLALAAGITIFIASFTGVILVFEKEFLTSIYAERYYVEDRGNRLPIEELTSIIKKEIPGAKINSVKVYRDATRTVEVSFINEKEKKKGQKSEKDVVAKKEPSTEKGKAGEKGHGKRDNIQTAYINPYSGELITYLNQKKTFFATVLGIHRWLLVQPVGKTIMGISGLIFVFILITGIVLWWPKNKKILKQRLTFKWSGWKRINHDLHIVMGFYASIFLLIIALTGVGMSFKWVTEGIFFITGSENKQIEPPKSVVEEKPVISVDQVLDVAKKTLPEAEFYNISMPRDSSAVFVVNVIQLNAAHEKASDQIYVDQYSGEMKGTLLFTDKNVAQKIRSSFYPIHTGSIGNIPGKIIAFIVCLAGVSFPITGVVLWLNRLKKKDKKGRKKKSSLNKKINQKRIVSQV